MKNFSLSQDFECSLELLLRLRQERYQDPERYPELKNIRTLSMKEEGTKIYEERQIILTTSLPEGLSSLLPSSLEKLNEKSIFDTEKHVHSFEITPGDQTNFALFYIKGESKYTSLGPSRCQRHYEVEVTSKAFLISSLIEGFIADFYMKKLEKDRENMLKAIASSL